jgi:hypothetical protein
VNITKEQLTRELFAEIRLLAQECWDECSEIKKDTCSFHGERGFKIEPDEDQYYFHASHDSLIAMTLRDDEGILQGYSLIILYRSLHHKPVKCANVDTFYIRPSARAWMRGFIKAMEDQFFEREIVVVGWPVTPIGGLFEILKLLGYAPDDFANFTNLRGTHNVHRSSNCGRCGGNWFNIF